MERMWLVALLLVGVAGRVTAHPALALNIAAPAQIIRQINEVGPDGSYMFGFEASDGSYRIETRDIYGRVVGKYGFVDETGVLRSYEYSAGKRSPPATPAAAEPAAVPQVHAAQEPSVVQPQVRSETETAPLQEIVKSPSETTKESVQPQSNVEAVAADPPEAAVEAMPDVPAAPLPPKSHLAIGTPVVPASTVLLDPAEALNPIIPAGLLTTNPVVEPKHVLPVTEVDNSLHSSTQQTHQSSAHTVMASHAVHVPLVKQSQTVLTSVVDSPTPKFRPIIVIPLHFFPQLLRSTPVI